VLQPTQKPLRVFRSAEHKRYVSVLRNVLQVNTLFVALPEYYDDIATCLSRADWLVHNFRNRNPSEELFNPANYLYNRKIDGTEYRALVDLNVLQFIVNCLKKGSAHHSYRTGCALLVFCRLCNIKIEPALAIYERINYNAENLEEALTELELLRSLDNANVDDLAHYALGIADTLPHVEPVSIQREELGAQLTQYRRLAHWDSIYLLVLVAVSIYWDTRISSAQKLERYLDWMLRKFRLSLPCVVYAVRLYGHNPLPKMMKFRPDRPEHLRHTAIFNMTWDLFHVDHFFKTWSNPEKVWEEIFFTDDRMLRSVLRLAISVQYNKDLSPALHYLDDKQAATCSALIDSRNERSDRVYGTEEWSPEYRARQIELLERELFG